MSLITKKYFPKTSNKKKQEKKYPIKYELHLNEMPEDIPIQLRKKIISQLQKVPLNKYPEPFAQSITGLMSEWYGVDNKNIMIAPGSSAFIRLLLTYFSINCKGKIVISRPSFTYYEQYCNTQNIDFESWNLGTNFEYNKEEIKDLPDYSVVFLTTPNNPTGNSISLDLMESLLNEHPKSLFIVDEAYAEFLDKTMLPLIKKYDNLIILRTFSKAFAVAGIRCGVLFAQNDLVNALMGIQTPWQLSSFTIESIRVILEFIKNNSWFDDQIKKIINERNKLFNKLNKLKSNTYTFYPSEANFLMFKSKNTRHHKLLLNTCAKRGILIKNLTGEPRLNNFARVSIGSIKANNAFYKVIKDLHEKKYEK